MDNRLQLQLGDITAVKVDVIVNSTGKTMVRGGPVHAAVHAAAGPDLLTECRQVGECPPGEVRVTWAYGLPYQFIIHAVAPTWMGGGPEEKGQLAGCYRKALDIARARGAQSIAFPSLGSGLQPQIPLDVAAPIAIRTILDYLEENVLPERVIIVCFDVPTYQTHQKALRAALP